MPRVPAERPGSPTTAPELAEACAKSPPLATPHADPATLPNVGLVGAGSVSGGKLQGADVVASSLRKELRVCFAEEAVRAGAATAELRYGLRVGPAGSIEEACIAGRGSEALRVCAAGVMMATKFSAPNGPWAVVSGRFASRPPKESSDRP